MKKEREEREERDTHIALHSDEFKPSICALMVQLRLPVVALVKQLITRCSLCIACLRVGLCKLEGSTARDDVDMRREAARCHDGIAALNSQCCAVDREELGLSGAEDHGTGQGSRQDGRCRRHHEQKRLKLRREQVQDGKQTDVESNHS